jgi:hypothetical protein
MFEVNGIDTDAVILLAHSIVEATEQRNRDDVNSLDVPDLEVVLTKGRQGSYRYPDICASSKVNHGNGDKQRNYCTREYRVLESV